ncbi:FAD-binding protein [Salipaludibacillus daqingensis]|uniref:FAD-binding protein n=1 Tax=Salipaludibacillus daqingensis TaxID=3041001 RepID=UPI0024731664|nr:FAD-binding protein [Salipaludibacillus daqingensis]
MFDVVIIGQGLAGLLTAIRAKQENKRVAVIAEGTGKIMQSTGFMDLIPSSSQNLDESKHLFLQKNISEELIDQSVEWFKALMNEINLPYEGSVHFLSPVVTGAGYVKNTALYPTTVRPIPNKGDILIVGLNGIIDFQPTYVKENLMKERPDLNVSTVTVDFFKGSGRVLSQVDAARAMDDKQVRARFITSLKNEMRTKEIATPDLMIFPSCLGMVNHKDVIEDLNDSIGPVTEAPGLPPNAAAIRLHDALHHYAVKKGVRFYEDETVFHAKVYDGVVTEVLTGNQTKPQAIKLKQLVVASGGILGGGLEQVSTGLSDRTLSLPITSEGTLVDPINNIFYIGSSSKMPWSETWISGGIYTISSSYSVPFTSMDEKNKRRDEKCYINQA